MMAIDDKGRFISGDKLLAILARFSGSNEIVTTVDASMTIEDIGFKVRRNSVGDPYVSEQLKQWGGFGGEPSGAWVFPQVSLCPDGIYAAAQIANIAGMQKLSDLADNLPSYPMIRGNILVKKIEMEKFRPELLSALNPLSVDSGDGLR
jgi:phosphoglucosamine mutase